MPGDNKLSHHVLQKLNFAKNMGFQRHKYGIQIKKSFLAGSPCSFTEKENFLSKEFRFSWFHFIDLGGS